MHCGGLRAGEGTKGNPNPAGAAQVEHRELSWWAAPSEHSGDQWSAPSRRMSAPTRLPYRPPGWAAPAPPPDPDYEDVSSRPALPPGLLNPARDQLACLVETLLDPKKEADRHFLFTAQSDGDLLVRAQVWDHKPMADLIGTYGAGVSGTGSQEEAAVSLNDKPASRWDALSLSQYLQNSMSANAQRELPSQPPAEERSSGDPVAPELAEAAPVHVDCSRLSVIFDGFLEITRQVGVHCVERGHTLAQLWNLVLGEFEQLLRLASLRELHLRTTTSALREALAASESRVEAERERGFQMRKDLVLEVDMLTEQLVELRKDVYTIEHHLSKRVSTCRWKRALQLCMEPDLLDDELLEKQEEATKLRNYFQKVNDTALLTDSKAFLMINELEHLLKVTSDGLLRKMVVGLIKHAKSCKMKILEQRNILEGLGLSDEKLNDMSHMQLDWKDPEKVLVATKSMRTKDVVKMLELVSPSYICRFFEHLPDIEKTISYLRELSVNTRAEIFRKLDMEMASALLQWVQPKEAILFIKGLASFEAIRILTHPAWSANAAAEIIADSGPAEGSALLRELAPDQAAKMLREMKQEDAIPLLMVMPPKTTTAVCSALQPAECAELLSKFRHVQTASILQQMQCLNAALVIRELETFAGMEYMLAVCNELPAPALLCIIEEMELHDRAAIFVQLSLKNQSEILMSMPGPSDAIHFLDTTLIMNSMIMSYKKALSAALGNAVDILPAETLCKMTKQYMEEKTTRLFLLLDKHQMARLVMNLEDVEVQIDLMKVFIQLNYKFAAHVLSEIPEDLASRCFEFCSTKEKADIISSSSTKTTSMLLMSLDENVRDTLVEDFFKEHPECAEQAAEAIGYLPTHRQAVQSKPRMRSGRGMARFKSLSNKIQSANAISGALSGKSRSPPKSPSRETRPGSARAEGIAQETTEAAAEPDEAALRRKSDFQGRRRSVSAATDKQQSAFSKLKGGDLAADKVSKASHRLKRSHTVSEGALQSIKHAAPQEGGLWPRMSSERSSAPTKPLSVEIPPAARTSVPGSPVEAVGSKWKARLSRYSSQSQPGSPIQRGSRDGARESEDRELRVPVDASLFQAMEGRQGLAKQTNPTLPFVYIKPKDWRLQIALLKYGSLQPRPKDWLVKMISAVYAHKRQMDEKRDPHAAPQACTVPTAIITLINLFESSK
ncbi:hypothetical protein CYMTET_34187 [Cymbomonas tetramitiformis]|uniref:Uncharacterized protein n=1 Tax=Cymbomonas tetramitiformis TaxID=36881 RepID=A0AAE0KQF4_9CHLO|nr:hypothetical protein CYMTET_34187 [Cymbomonas tetramitiformis]